MRARSVSFVVVAALAVGQAACHPAHPVAPPVGAVAGLIRAADSGAGLPQATVVVRPAGGGQARTVHADDSGAYEVSGLSPGPYQVQVYVDERPVDDAALDVVGGLVTGHDVVVAPAAEDTLGLGDAPPVPPLVRFHPVDADRARSAIEGTVSEASNATRLAGAVVSVLDGAGALVAQVVSDDRGRFQLADLVPGEYAVSAYYQVLGRGQFEVRRNAVRLDGGDVVEVPLVLITTSH